jgi:hypothetical protein
LSYFPGNYMSQSFLKSPPYTFSYGPVISNGASGGTPNLLLSSGTPLPVIGDITVPSGTFQAEALDFKNTRVRQYNVVVEKEIAGNVVGAGYVGWSADRYTQYLANVDLAPAGAGPIQPRRAFAATLPNVSQISLISDGYEAAYNAMQLTFQRRARAGLTLSSSYTLAHATMTNAAPWDTTIVEHYDADLDVRHRVVLSANYELPFFRQGGGVLAGVFGGWQLNAIGSWQTGLPFTVGNGAARSNTGGTDRPNQVGDPQLDDPTIQQWFNVQAFAAQPINTAGNTGRNTLHGPQQRRLDLSLFKTVGLRGPVRLQLRAEAYNVTNTPSFANPNANFGTAGFGSISSTVLIPRQMQFAVKVLF